ncbi:hydroxyphenylacetyl-CoA thioesterase PaaI [Actinomadura bangladeshensis]|uniref:Hydroxyphenylacetyl-CoA thioesterase PaaI n=2 Tax=Actinomadura bangladeshensis TaxID=453573 RepID=A0A4R4P8B1_9ACTN|nr:hydroxyphenylacetyl-CoA thioesterase PaaI [Actinomadura bangladeshensis]
MTEDAAEDAAEGAAEVARRCAETMYARDKVAQDLAMEIAEVAPGRARLRMTVADTMVNGFGIAHGGYLFLLADSAFAYACNTHDAVTVAASADVVFVASARGGDVLEATAVERVRYGRSGIYDVTVRRVPDGEVIAEFRGGSRSRDLRVIGGGAP